MTTGKRLVGIPYARKERRGALDLLRGDGEALFSPAVCGLSIDSVGSIGHLHVEAFLLLAARTSSMSALLVLISVCTYSGGVLCQPGMLVMQKRRWIRFFTSSSDALSTRLTAGGDAGVYTPHTEGFVPSFPFSRLSIFVCPGTCCAVSFTFKFHPTILPRVVGVVTSSLGRGASTFSLHMWL